MLAAIVDARMNDVAPAIVARAFHRSLAQAIAEAIRALSKRASVEVVVLSGGVIQNALLVDDLHAALASSGLELWLNRNVPPNDGGLSVGQAALAIGAACV